MGETITDWSICCPQEFDKVVKSFSECGETQTSAPDMAAVFVIDLRGEQPVDLAAAKAPSGGIVLHGKI